MLKDVEKFLLESIQNNTINYSQDKNSRDWSFRYYLDNATDRLTRLHNDFKKKGFAFQLPGSSHGQSARERWEKTQQSLDDALDKFELMLKGISPHTKPPKASASSSTKLDKAK